MTVGRIGVGTGVDGAAGGGGDTLVSPSSTQEQDGRDDGDHQNETGYGYANRKVSRRDAQLVIFILFSIKFKELITKFFDNRIDWNHFIEGLSVKEPRVSVVRRVRDVKTAKDFDRGVLRKERIVDAILGGRPTQIRLTLPPPQIVALAVTQRRL